MQNPKKHTVHFSPPTFHPPVISKEHEASVAEKIREIAQAKDNKGIPRIGPTGSCTVPLTTVTNSGNYDSWIDLEFLGVEGTTSLLVDSGNSTLIIPDYSVIEGNQYYTVLIEDTTEPWGCPAKVVQGPINVVIDQGLHYTLNDCIFYACTGVNPDCKENCRPTANFGTACLNSWQANSSNTPGNGIVIMAPLAYGGLSCAVFNYAPTNAYPTLVPYVSQESTLVLSKSQSADFTVFDVIPNYPWMALFPFTISIGSEYEATGWPGVALPSGTPGSREYPVAFIDTGGGPVFLSDPEGYIYDKTWPNPTTCPSWINNKNKQGIASTDCNCVEDSMTIGFTDGQGNTFVYFINLDLLPSDALGTTLVPCQNNMYMMNQYGMNIGGISIIFFKLLIDYANKQVGFLALG